MTRLPGWHRACVGSGACLAAQLRITTGSPKRLHKPPTILDRRAKGRISDAPRTGWWPLSSHPRQREPERRSPARMRRQARAKRWARREDYGWGWAGGATKPNRAGSPATTLKPPIKKRDDPARISRRALDVRRTVNENNQLQTIADAWPHRRVHGSSRQITRFQIATSTSGQRGASSESP